MAKVLPNPSHSLKEFRILPGYTPADGNASDVELKTRLCRKGDGFVYLNTPFLSAARALASCRNVGVDSARLKT